VVFTGLFRDRKATIKQSDKRGCSTTEEDDNGGAGEGESDCH